MKVYYYIILVFIIMSNQAFAKLENINTNYELNLNVLGFDIKIGEIKSYLVIDSNDYSLKFDMASEKLVNLITPIFGHGIVSGKIKDKNLYPVTYEYSYNKKKKNKITEILFNNSLVVSSKTLPEFDKKKLSPITNEMLNNVIDPITGIIFIGDYELNNKCSVNYKIYDGKRRYDLIYTNILHKDGYVLCRLIQKKIGGFKIDNDQKNLFKPAQEIDTYFKKVNGQYVLEKIITKSEFSKILINVSYF